MNQLNLIFPVRRELASLLRRKPWAGLVILLASISLTGSGDAGAEDRLAGDLFSKITMSETTAATSAKNGTFLEKRSEILGVVSLSKVLSAAKIKSEVQSQTVLVRLADLLPGLAETNSLGELRLSVDAEANRIDAVLPVRTIAGNQSVQGPKLMSLLVALSDISGIQLAASGQTIAFHTSLINQNVTSDGIRAVAERLVAAAKKTEPITSTIMGGQRPAGSAIAKSVESAAQSTPAQPPPAQPTTLVSTAKPASVVGTWSSKTSASDAWAIRFDADNTFVMVHTRSGKNSVSKGSYQATENRLVVSETGGVTLKGQLDRSGEKAFAWKLQNDSGQTLTTLTFTKK